MRGMRDDEWAQLSGMSWVGHDIRRLQCFPAVALLWNILAFHGFRFLFFDTKTAIQLVITKQSSF